MRIPNGEVSIELVMLCWNGRGFSGLRMGVEMELIGVCGTNKDVESQG